MADFFQANQQDQQDPEAIRRAQLLAALMGRTPGIISPPGTPGAPGAPQPAQPGFAIPNPGDANQPTARVAQPTSSAKSPVAKPMATPTTAIEPGNQAPMPTFASEEEWNKANPPAAHVPYVEPDLKHRLLMGIFSGMQEFGKNPGAGERMLGSYLGDIEKNEELEKKYPENSAAAQHLRYMTAAQGAEAPAHLQELQAHIQETEASAKEKNAKAKAEANPAPKYQHIVVEDPAKPGTPKAALFDEKTGAYIDPDTQKAIPGAKPFEKPEKVEPAKIGYDSGIPVTITAKGQTYDVNDPNLPAELKPLVTSAVGAHKQRLQEEADAQARALKNNEGKHTASELAQVERETRTAIRKADSDYRTAESTANLQRNFIAEAKGGNKAAVKIVPLEGALEITTSQGVHRINRTASTARRWSSTVALAPLSSTNSGSARAGDC